MADVPNCSSCSLPYDPGDILPHNHEELKMKKITLDKELLAQNTKRLKWHLPSRPPFTVTDLETNETYPAHSVIVEGAPTMIKYEQTTDEFSVITHGTVSIYDHASKTREEIK
jgi:hypothetical protein